MPTWWARTSAASLSLTARVCSTISDSGALSTLASGAASGRRPVPGRGADDLDAGAGQRRGEGVRGGRGGVRDPAEPAGRATLVDPERGDRRDHPVGDVVVRPVRVDSGPVNSESSYPTRTRRVPSSRSALAVARARVTTSARRGYAVASAGRLARNGSPPPTSTIRLRPSVTTWVREACGRGRASRARRCWSAASSSRPAWRPRCPARRRASSAPSGGHGDEHAPVRGPCRRARRRARGVPAPGPAGRRWRPGRGPRRAGCAAAAGPGPRGAPPRPGPSTGRARRGRTSGGRARSGRSASRPARMASTSTTGSHRRERSDRDAWRASRRATVSPSDCAFAAIVRETCTGPSEGPTPTPGPCGPMTIAEEDVLEFDVLVEIPKGSRNKYEVDHESWPHPPRPHAVHVDAVPRGLRLHREHPRARTATRSTRSSSCRSRRSPAA